MSWDIGVTGGGGDWDSGPVGASSNEPASNDYSGGGFSTNLNGDGNDAGGRGFGDSGERDGNHRGGCFNCGREG